MIQDNAVVSSFSLIWHRNAAQPDASGTGCHVAGAWVAAISGSMRVRPCLVSGGGTQLLTGPSTSGPRRLAPGGSPPFPATGASPPGSSGMAASSIGRNRGEKPEGDVPPFLWFPTVRGATRCSPSPGEGGLLRQEYQEEGTLGGRLRRIPRPLVTRKALFFYANACTPEATSDTTILTGSPMHPLPMTDGETEDRGAP